MNGLYVALMLLFVHGLNCLTSEYSIIFNILFTNCLSHALVRKHLTSQNFTWSLLSDLSADIGQRVLCRVSRVLLDVLFSSNKSFINLTL